MGGGGVEGGGGGGGAVEESIKNTIHYSMENIIGIDDIKNVVLTRFW